MREIGRVLGAKFYADDDETPLFVYGIDANNVLGPRPATKADKAKYPGEWAQYLEGLGSGPLDGDADGKDGGSLPHEPKRRGRPKKVTARGDDAPPDHSADV